MVKWRKGFGLRQQLLAVLAFAGVCGAAVFCFLWGQEYNFWIFCQRFPTLSWDEAAFSDTLRTMAAHTVVPQSDIGESNPELDAFFEQRDAYTSVYLYSMEDGLFLCGAYAKIMDQLSYRGIFDLGYAVTSGRSEMIYTEVMQFANCKAEVVIYSYHRAKTVYPYFAFCLILAILVFLYPTLWFIHRKMKHILRLKEDILGMAAGDLTQPVAYCGKDEIGILAHELDRLRVTLDHNIRLEAQSRKANQDLITAMSHDLRTPLTILHGYLEILQLGRGDPARWEEYLDRCLRKTGDIKAMTDKMFEYSLVFSDHVEPSFSPLPVTQLLCDLEENCDFIRLAGFTVSTVFSPVAGHILGDITMLQRVFINLFSNILKYGDKQIPVCITCSAEREQIKITFSNAIQSAQDRMESNRIGLKSVEEIVSLHHGTFYYSMENQMFLVHFMLPLLPY